jgi:hypothetical protein
MIGTSQLINTFSRPCFTDTTDIFKDGSGVALYGLDYDASDAGGASGKFGEAAIFNGSSSYINLGDPTSGITTANYSISFWVNTTSTSASYLISKYLGDGIDSTDIFRVRNLSDGTISFRTSTSNPSARDITSTSTINDGNWHHILFTVEPNLSKLYINGTEEGSSTTGTAKAPSSISRNVTIGRHDGGDNYFNGKIDQVRIYDSTLTQSQVTQLYQENNSTVGTHLFGCIANYNLDGSAKESMGTTAYDGTETDITYRYDGTPTAVDFGVGGKSDYGARFNGSSSYISGVPALTNSNAEFTISMWFKCNTTASSQYLFGEIRENGTYDPLFLIWLNTSGYLNTEFRNNSSSTSGVTITDSTNYCDDSWHHIVSILTTSQMKMYIDGSEVSSSPANISGVCDVNNISIGARNNRGTNGNWFNGDIDQVRIFSKALSSNEVGKLYGNGAGEIACAYTSTTDDAAYPIANTAYYKLDNNSKDSARSTGKFNEGAIFNGSSSKIVLPTSTFSPSTFSLSAWCNVTSDTDENTILELFDNQTYPNHTTIVLSAGGTGYSSRFLLRNYATNQYNYNPSGTVSKNVWKHYAMTYDGSTVKSYIDGSLVDSGSLTLSNTVGTISSIQIGLSSGSRHLNGSIDQVRIYNTALDSTDVSNLYAETVSDTSTLSFPSGKTAIATYQLDGNSTDLSGNYNGTDTNITYAYDGTESNIEYRFGRYGQAAVFNGSSSGINLPSSLNTSVIDATGAFSISMWINANDISTIQYLFCASTANNIDLGINSNNLGVGKIVWTIYNTTYSQLVSTTTITTGIWYNIVATYDNGSRELFINGVSQGTATKTLVESSIEPTLGYRNTGGSVRFNGLMDQVRIYSTALTSSQVTQLYNEKPEVDTSNFKTVLYTGNGSTQYISNVGFEPDMVWAKARSNTHPHVVFDIVRGENKQINPDETSAEVTRTSGAYEFETNGFTVSTAGNSNNNNYTYVAWCWKGGGDDVLNEEGTIDSQVSANTEAGFSIVKYTGSSTIGDTIGHGITVDGVATTPDLIIVKNLDTNGTSWATWSSEFSSASETLFLDLNSSSSQYTNRFGTVNATTFQAGSSGGSEVNSSGNEMIAYVWKSIAGYSKIGAYPGSGVSGKEVALDFNPSFVLIKRTNASTGWIIIDNQRGTKELYANLQNAEDTSTTSIVLGTNKFTLNTTGSWYNASGGTYLYMAFK